MLIISGQFSCRRDTFMYIVSILLSAIYFGKTSSQALKNMGHLPYGVFMGYLSNQTLQNHRIFHASKPNNNAIGTRALIKVDWQFTTTEKETLRCLVRQS